MFQQKNQPRRQSKLNRRRGFLNIHGDSGDLMEVTDDNMDVTYEKRREPSTDIPIGDYIYEADDNVTGIKIVYLWISHGIAVSRDHCLREMESKFKKMYMFTRFLDPGYGHQLERFRNNICSISHHGYIVRQKEQSGKTLAYLPPIVFEYLEKDTIDPYMSQVMGLNRYELNYSVDIYGKKSCTVIKNERLFDLNSMLRMYGDGNYITYSQIFKVVEDNCKKNNISPNDITLAIFSCQVLTL